MTHRSLLLTAVVTVTVPGVLGIFAVLGHEHASTSRDATAATLAGAALANTGLTGPFPVAPATTTAGVRNDIAAAQQASGAPVTVLNRVTGSQQAMGMRLLGKAAAAGLATSYQGTERISQSGVDGRVTLTSQVWHQGGGLTLVQSAGGARSGVSADTGSDSPEGVFGVTKSLVALLSKHYVAVYRGGGSAAGRKAAVVDLYRFDGSLAARYWLDRQTTLPLRRELFTDSDTVISEDSFVRVQFGASPARRPAAVPSQQAQQPAWVAASAPARLLASLAGQGWRLPRALPGGLPLYAAASATTATGRVVDLEYSDGLYVVSLFVQRGALASDMAGWQPARVAGQQAYVSGHSVAWAGTGVVYTMIADAPPQTVTQVVQALPDGGPPSLLSRLGQGFERLIRLISPLN